jgi:hypothetical protein
MPRREIPAERRRESRLFVEVPGTYREAGPDARELDIMFGQISANGCRLTNVAPHLGIGDVIALHLGPIGPLAATIRWRRDAMAGVEFHEPLETAIVDFFAAFCGAAA